MRNSITTYHPTHTPFLRKWRGPGLLASAALLASFLFVRAKTQQAELDNPPEGKFIEVDGIRLHYTVHGDGPPLLLLHGNGVTHSDFDTSGLTEQLARNHRVYIFDRPGYGYSDRPRTTVWTPRAQAELLYHALGQLGVEHPVVLGHSWGTMVAVAMGIAYPGYVRGLVLLSGYYYPSVRLDTPILSPPAIPILGDLLRYTLSPLLGRVLWPLITRQMFSPAPVDERFRRLPVWMMLRPSQLRAGAAESALMIPSAMMLKKHYPELAMPVAIIAGSGDRVVDPDNNSTRLHNDVLRSTLRVEPGVGHMIHYARPETIIRAVDQVSLAERADLSHSESTSA
ncbi:MAG TPA: alpha/beta hydrolase [Telluria sp.]